MNWKNALRSIPALSLALVACGGDAAPSSGAGSADVQAPALHPPSPDYFTIDTGEVTLEVRGDGVPGSPIVLLHGFPDGNEAWDFVARELGYEHRVYSPDLRGYALSDKPADVGAYAMNKLAADIKAVVDYASAEHGGEPVLLVGHDWGSIAMFTFAHQHPEHVKGIVSINGVHPDVLRRECATNPLQRQAFAYINLFNTPGFEFVLAADNFKALSDGMIDGQGQPVLDDYQLDRYRENWAQPGALTGMLNWYRANIALDPTFTTGPTLSSAVPSNLTVDTQTLFLWGDRDPALLPGNLVGLDDYISSVTVKHFPDAGHWLMHEHPFEVVDEIYAFSRHLDGH